MNLNFPNDYTEKRFPLFGKQLIVNLETRLPLDVQSGTDNSFFIATKSLTSEEYYIQHFILEEDEYKLSHEFRAISKIRKSYYLKRVDWVITLEKDIAKKSTARIYYNWRDKIEGSEKYVTHVKHPKHDKTIEIHLQDERTEESELARYIQLPISRPIRCVATCPITSRFAVATKHKISVFECTKRTVTLLYEFLLDINLKALAIFDNYISFASQYEVRVLCIDLAISELSSQSPGTQNYSSFLVQRTENKQTTNEFSTSVHDDQCIECYFDYTGKSKNTSRLIDLPRLRKNIEHRVEEMEVEMLGPLTETVDFCIQNIKEGYVVLSSSVILHRQFPHNTPLQSVLFLPEFEEITIPISYSSNNKKNNNNKEYINTKNKESDVGEIIPGYGGDYLSQHDDDDSDNNIQNQIENSHFNNSNRIYDVNNNNNDNDNEAKDKKSTTTIYDFADWPNIASSMIGLRFFISTTKKGYLYDIKAPRLLSEYNFSDECFSATLSDTFLYMITVRGLEVWTLRSCLSAGEDFPPPCLINRFLFNCLQKIVLVDDFVILFSKELFSTSSISSSSPPSFTMKQTPNDAINDTEPRILRDFKGKYKNILQIFTKQPQSSPSPSSSSSPSINHPPSSISMNENEIGWNIYILKLSEVGELYHDVQSSAIASRDQSDLSSYFQLSLEAHLLLSAYLQHLQHRLYILYLSSTSSSSPMVLNLSSTFGSQVALIQHYYSLLRSSNAHLADYYLETHRYQRSAVFFRDSDRQMSKVIPPLVEAAMSNPSGGARRALATYLDSILFQPLNDLTIIDETYDLSNEILRLYFTIARNKLPSVILQSRLQLFDLNLALQLLEDDSEFQSIILNSTIHRDSSIRQPITTTIFSSNEMTTSTSPTSSSSPLSSSEITFDVSLSQGNIDLSDANAKFFNSQHIHNLLQHLSRTDSQTHHSTHGRSGGVAEENSIHTQYTQSQSHPHLHPHPHSHTDNNNNNNYKILNDDIDSLRLHLSNDENERTRFLNPSASSPLLKLPPSSSSSFSSSSPPSISPLHTSLSFSSPSIPTFHPPTSTINISGGSNSGSGGSNSGSNYYRLTNGKNTFVRGLLYMAMEKIENAREDFQSLSPEVMVEFCISHPSLLFSPPSFLLNYRKNIHSPPPPHLNINVSNDDNNNDNDVIGGEGGGGSEQRYLTLGEFLCEFDGWVLLDVILQLQNTISIDQSLKLLNASLLSDLPTSLLFSDYTLILQCYLEETILMMTMNDDVRVVDSHPQLFELLFSIYLKQIQSNSNQFFLSIFNLSTRKPPSSSSSSTRRYHGDEYYDCDVDGNLTQSRLQLKEKWLNRRLFSFIKYRADWLNLLPPFYHYKFDRSEYGRDLPDDLEISRLIPDECTPIDYFYLLKLQGLICFLLNHHLPHHPHSSSLPSSSSSSSKSSSSSSTVFRSVRSNLLRMMERGGNFTGKISIELLVLPSCGYFNEAVDILMNHAPHISRHFSRYFCCKASQWRSLLSALLPHLSISMINNDDNDNNDDNNDNNNQREEIYCVTRENDKQIIVNEKDRYDIYREVWEEMANIVDPEVVLSLIPPNGNVEFYLPFIRQTFQNYAIKNIRHMLIHQTKSKSEF